MTAPRTPGALPFTVSKYEVLTKVGEGAMGAVYRGRDTVLNRTVAIKLMNATIAADPGPRERFLREAQSAGSLQHPNVVTIFDFGEADGHLFIAMEFVEGTDLETALDSGHFTTIQSRLDVVIDTLQGLAYAHHHGIIHRDLKPANIRVTTNGRGKLMDFGVAHLQSNKMTQTGFIVGTPHYMAPEYISGQPISTASDIFSMGVVLYEVLTGQRPFDGDNTQALLFAVIQHEPPPPSQLVPGLSPALDAIVQRAMAKAPGGRYASAQEMATALMQVRATMSGAPAFDLSQVGTLSTKVPKAPTPSQPAPAAPTPSQPAPVVPTPTAGNPVMAPPTPPSGYPAPTQVSPVYGAPPMGTPPQGMPGYPPGYPQGYPPSNPQGVPPGYSAPSYPPGYNAGGYPPPPGYQTPGYGAPAYQTPPHPMQTPVQPTPVVRIERPPRSKDDLDFPRQRSGGGFFRFLLVLLLIGSGYVAYLMNRDQSTFEQAFQQAKGDGLAFYQRAKALILAPPPADSSPVPAANEAPKPAAKPKPAKPKATVSPAAEVPPVDTATVVKIDSQPPTPPDTLR